MDQPTMQKGNLVAAPADVHGRISKQTVALEGVSVTRVTFAPGARWSVDLKPYAGTDLCELPHVAVVLSGRLGVQMRDGSTQEFTADDVMLLSPGMMPGRSATSRSYSSSSPEAMTTTRNDRRRLADREAAYRSCLTFPGHHFRVPEIILQTLR